MRPATKAGLVLLGIVSGCLAAVTLDNADRARAPTAPATRAALDVPGTPAPAPTDGKQKRSDAPTCLRDLGITKDEGARAKRLAEPATQEG